MRQICLRLCRLRGPLLTWRRYAAWAKRLYEKPAFLVVYIYAHHTDRRDVCPGSIAYDPRVVLSQMDGLLRMGRCRLDEVIQKALNMKEHLQDLCYRRLLGLFFGYDCMSAQHSPGITRTPFS